MKIQVELKGFTPILDKLIDEYGLITAAVFGAVWRYAQQEDGECWASANTIADRLSLNRRTIVRHLKKLVEGGYLIDLTPDLQGQSHHYTYTAKASITGEIEGGVTESHRGCDRESQVPVTESHTKKQYKKQYKKQSPGGENGQPKTLSDSDKAHLLTFGALPEQIKNNDNGYDAYDAIQEIKNVGWEIRDPSVERAAAYYLEAVRLKLPSFAVPNNESVRSDWYKSIKGHLQDYAPDDLKQLYRVAIDHLNENKMSFSRPGSLTRTLPALAGEGLIEPVEIDWEKGFYV